MENCLKGHEKGSECGGPTHADLSATLGDMEFDADKVWAQLLNSNALDILTLKILDDLIFKILDVQQAGGQRGVTWTGKRMGNGQLDEQVPSQYCIDQLDTKIRCCLRELTLLNMTSMEVLELKQVKPLNWDHNLQWALLSHWICKCTWSSSHTHIQTNDSQPKGRMTVYLKLCSRCV